MTTHGFRTSTIATLFVPICLAACNTQIPLGNLGNSIASRDVIPDAISLDVSEVGDEDTNAARSKDAEAARCTGDPAVDRTLRAGAVVIHSFHRIADRALALGARIRLDIDDPAQTQVSGLFMANGEPVSYKADFAAFDFDGDGVVDGSGMANVEPVALRIWVDKGDGSGFQPFMCALVTTRPTSMNLGAGEIVFRPLAADKFSSPDLQLRVMYDRTNPGHKWNESYASGRVRGDVRMSFGRHRVDVRGDEEGNVEKTVRSSTVFTEHPLGFENYKFAAHFQRGGGAVLLSGQSSGGSVQVNFDNVCVDLPSCTIDAEGAACAGFDTQDMSFLDPPAGGETDFPADFPATPTF
ncbi:MAG: hypothetical protein DCC65_00210 [Planctomycetota bacterium]|nr:MAG: hypothetical protein DCC65_00210 [Planctomycetota bacterium]